MKNSRILLLLCILVLNFIISSVAYSVTFIVNSTADVIDVNPGDGVCKIPTSNNCTLRAAVQEANALTGADIIELPIGTYILSIIGREENGADTGDLDIIDDLAIIGTSATNTIIDANKIDRIFDVFDPAYVTISNVTIQNGDLAFTGSRGEHGGGIRNRGSLALNEFIVFENTAGVLHGIGGGIFNVGTLNLTNVAVSGNSADATGGLANFSGGDVTLTNVTISDNIAFGGTAGMENGEGVFGQSATAMLTNVTISGNIGGLCTACGGGFGNKDNAILKNVTISGNSGSASGGIFITFAGPVSASTQLENTIIANNLGKNCNSTLTPILSLGHNLSSDNTCNLTSPYDFENTIPLLGPLQDNGGFTLTHSLLSSSPAIDAGSPDCPPPYTDQRGEPRPVDGDDDELIACDIGAFEIQPAIKVIRLDIKPDSQINKINLRSKGVIAVAVITSEGFDAFLVDPDTVQFGPANAEMAHSQAHIEDVDYDGDYDLLFHFLTADTNINCIDTEATLTGQTWDGTLISGTDSINPIRCR